MKWSDIYDETIAHLATQPLEASQPPPFRAVAFSKTQQTPTDWQGGFFSFRDGNGPLPFGKNPT